MPDIELSMQVSTVMQDEGNWELVHGTTFQPEAGTYKGECTYEDYAFLVDPLQLVTGADWVKMAKEDLPREIIAKYAAEGATPLRLEIYISIQKVLFGLVEYPAIRVKSWHHGSPVAIIVIALIIGVIIGAAVILIIFYFTGEAEWVLAAAGAGLGILILGLLLLGGLKAKKYIKKFKEI